MQSVFSKLASVGVLALGLALVPATLPAQTGRTAGSDTPTTATPVQNGNTANPANSNDQNGNAVNPNKTPTRQQYRRRGLPRPTTTATTAVAAGACGAWSDCWVYSGWPVVAGAPVTWRFAIGTATSTIAA